MESVFVSFWRFHSCFSDVSTLPLPYRHRKHTLFYVSTHEVRKKTRVFVFKAHHRFTGWTNRVTQKAGSGKALANQDLLSSTAETRCNQFLKEKRLTCLLLFSLFSDSFVVYFTLLLFYRSFFFIPTYSQSFCLFLSLYFQLFYSFISVLPSSLLSWSFSRTLFSSSLAWCP